MPLDFTYLQSMKAVELFAGLGGFAEGTRGTGVDIVWAANHWQSAASAYSANHPTPIPVCQDLQQANFYALPDHDIQLASPACQGHCYARGKERPHHDEARATAWAVVNCAEAKRPSAILVENVPEFLTWLLYPAWEAALQALGYSVSPHLVDAADYGVPQHRQRALIVAVQAKAPFVLHPMKRDHIPFRAIIEGDAPLWSPIRTKCLNTRRRAKRGRASFGDYFVMPYYSKGSGLTGRSVARPIGTITTRDRWALVEGNRMRMLTVLESQRAMGFRDDYLLPRNKKLARHLLGNAVPPAMVSVTLDDLIARL